MSKLHVNNLGSFHPFMLLSSGCLPARSQAPSSCPCEGGGCRLQLVTGQQERQPGGLSIQPSTGEPQLPNDAHFIPLAAGLCQARQAGGTGTSS